MQNSASTYSLPTNHQLFDVAFLESNLFPTIFPISYYPVVRRERFKAFGVSIFPNIPQTYSPYIAHIFPIQSLSIYISIYLYICIYEYLYIYIYSLFFPYIFHYIPFGAFGASQPSAARCCRCPRSCEPRWSSRRRPRAVASKNLGYGVQYTGMLS